MGRNKLLSKLPRLLAVILAIGMFMGHVNAANADSTANTTDIVDPSQMITYELMLQQIDQLAVAYPELIEVKPIGTTAFGREIKAVKLGKGEVNVLIDASQHAREWMGTNLVMYMIERYAYAYEHNMKYNQYVVRELLDNCSIWFVPMVNPDGVTLQQKGLNAFPANYHTSLIQMNGNSTNFSRWKANAQGIDINRQYPAMWDNIRDASKYPMFKNYKGTAPAVAAEAKSMINFTYEIDPEIALSYHTSGEILFWYFNTKPEHLARDKTMADTITRMTGYSQFKPTKDPSGGGFTDWFIQEFNRPGFTLELGGYQEDTSLPLRTFPGIWGKNQDIGLYIAAEGYKLWRERPAMVKANENIQLLETAKLYNRPDEAYPVGAELSGKVTTEAKLGDWYRISTWLGAKWIHLDSIPYLQGHSEKYVETIELKDTTVLYSHPNQDGKGKLGELTPQSVEALERWNDWVLINTWFGTSWIQMTSV